MNTVLTILHEFIGQLYLLWKRNRKVQRQIDHLEKRKPQPNYVNLDHPLFDLDVLLRHLHQEQARRQIIEDKARTNILGITLAFTVILASVAFACRTTNYLTSTSSSAICTKNKHAAKSSRTKPEPTSSASRWHLPSY